MLSFTTSIPRSLFLAFALSLLNLKALSFATRVYVQKNHRPYSVEPVSSTALPPKRRAAFVPIQNPVTKPDAPSLWQRLHARVNKFRQTTAALKAQVKKRGFAAMAAFALVSNAQLATAFSTAWFLHASRTGLSPLAVGQWKSFLPLYTGLSATAKVFMPLTLGVALVLAPHFQDVFDWIHQRLRLPKVVAMASVTLVAGLGVMAAIIAPGILVTSAVTGVSVFAV